MYVYKVYDAVWTVAKALHEMDVNGETLTAPNLTCIQCNENSLTKWSDGGTLLQKMKAVSYIVKLFSRLRIFYAFIPKDLYFLTDYPNYKCLHYIKMTKQNDSLFLSRFLSLVSFILFHLQTKATYSFKDTILLISDITVLRG